MNILGISNLDLIAKNLLIILEGQKITDAYKDALQILPSLIITLPKRLQGIVKELVNERENQYFPKRGFAANLLGKIGYEHAYPKLLKILLDPSENIYVRGAAAEAIGELGVKDAVPKMINLLTEEYQQIENFPFDRRSSPSRVISAVAFSLGLIGDERAIFSLITLLDSKIPEIWMAAIDSLYQFEDHSVIQVLLEKYIISTENGSLKASLMQLILQKDLISHIPFFISHSNLENEIIKTFEMFILQQGQQNLMRLYILREKSVSREILLFIDNLVEKIQPIVLTSEGLNIML